MPASRDDWNAEFATPVIRDGLARLIDESTPGLIDRLASDPKAFTELIAVTKVAADQVAELLAEAVLSARHVGLTWEQIGEALDITRQEAQIRFSAPHSKSAPSPTTIAENPFSIGQRVWLRPLEWGNEMPVLNIVGQYGWHSVDYGTEYHIVEFSNQQWEHARSLRRPRGENWQKIKGGLYWKRPTGKSILPGDPRPETFLPKTMLARITEAAFGEFDSGSSSDGGLFAGINQLLG